MRSLPVLGLLLSLGLSQAPAADSTAVKAKTGSASASSSASGSASKAGAASDSSPASAKPGSTSAANRGADPCLTGRKANLAAIDAFYQAFNTQNSDLLDRALAKNWVDVPLSPGQAPGRDGMKPMIAIFAKSFPDLKITRDDLLISGDKIVVRSTLRGTHKGDFAGIPPQNKVIDIMAIDIHQLKCGRIVKTWHVEDWMSGLFQMGAFAPPASSASGTAPAAPGSAPGAGKPSATGSK